MVSLSREDAISMRGGNIYNQLRETALRACEHYSAVIARIAGHQVAVFGLIVVPFSTTGTVMPLEQAGFSFLAAEAAAETTIDRLVDAVSDQALGLGEEISFAFSQPIDTERVTVQVFPQTDVMTLWDAHGTSLSIIPRAGWAPDTRYSIAFGVEDHEGAAVIYHFRSESLPQITHEEIPMERGHFLASKDAVLTLRMDRVIDAYDFKVIPRTPLPITLEPLLGTQDLRIIFTDELTKHTEVDLLLYVRHRDLPGEQFTPVDEISVRMAAPPPDVWPRAQTERMEVMRDRILPQIMEGKYIDINLEARVTTLFEDGEIVHMFVNSPGAAATPTPKGTYKVENKAVRALSASFGVYLPYWMAFTADGKYGLHDLIEWPEDHPERPEGAYKESVSSIDRAVSPGCVRHTPSQSQTLYEWAPVGTPIIIY